MRRRIFLLSFMFNLNGPSEDCWPFLSFKIRDNLSPEHTLVWIYSPAAHIKVPYLILYPTFGGGVGNICRVWVWLKGEWLTVQVRGEKDLTQQKATKEAWIEFWISNVFSFSNPFCDLEFWSYVHSTSLTALLQICLLNGNSFATQQSKVSI